MSSSAGAPWQILLPTVALNRIGRWAAVLFVDNKYAVPVFYGAPNRAYVVLGYLNAETAPVRSRRGAVIAFMARRAQELGGNGLIVVGTNREYAGSVSSASVSGNVYGRGFSATGFGTTTPLFGGEGDAVVLRLL